MIKKYFVLNLFLRSKKEDRAEILFCTLIIGLNFNTVNVAHTQNRIHAHHNKNNHRVF